MGGMTFAGGFLICFVFTADFAIMTMGTICAFLRHKTASLSSLLAIIAQFATKRKMYRFFLCSKILKYSVLGVAR